MHLLVIEDERALCETIVRSLRRLAYSVDYCYDGEKALELLGVERYDLVLLDLNLPGKDGMTVLRTLRQTDRETRVLIYRLLFNLTENVVKYNHPDGSVQVTVSQEPEKLLIRVSDTGCGIPEEYQRSIFQPFFRVDKSRSREYGGAGLGLSLVWEIANLHDGSVRVEESSDRGTTIAVELPVQ